MLLKNKTVGVYHINAKPVLPNQTIEVPDSFATNPVIKKLIDREKLVIVEVKAEQKQVEEQQEEKEIDAVAEFEALASGEVTLAKLRAFAKRHKIDLGEAKTIEDMTTVIKACVTVK